MSRPRAGHSFTAIWRNGRMIPLMQDVHGRWVTTGEAKGWPRCTRCRRPHQISPDDSGLCTTCYFYKTLSVDEFWRRHKAGDYLAPYNIGKRCMENHEALFDLQDHPNWRARIKAQTQ